MHRLTKFIVWGLSAGLLLAACGGAVGDPTATPQPAKDTASPTESAPPETAEPTLAPQVLAWQSAEEPCKALLIGEGDLVFGLCDETLAGGDLPAERWQELQELRQMYASFEAETPAGNVSFRGEGQQPASPAGQRRVAEWARLAYQEAEFGRSGASWGLALTWHREGGIAGFCDDLSIYVTGRAYASACGGQQPVNLGSAWLDDGQQEQLYDWFDRYGAFELGRKDPATADAMLVRLSFWGAGDDEPGPEVKEQMTAFAAEVHAGVAMPAAAQPAEVQAEPEDKDLQRAQQALLDFFAAVNAGEYARAANLFGGDAEVLRGYNPDIPPEDLVALLEAGCRYNGFQCNLQVLRMLRAERISPDRYRFTVEFSQPDGSLFVLGPCCGASVEEMPPRSQFEYTVVQSGDRFRVEGLPVYVP